MVIDNGTVAECGEPYQLLQEKGLFYDMAQHTGENAAIITNLAYESHLERN